MGEVLKFGEDDKEEGGGLDVAPFENVDPSSTAPEGVVYAKLRTSDITGTSQLQKGTICPSQCVMWKLEPGKHT